MHDITGEKHNNKHQNKLILPDQYIAAKSEQPIGIDLTFWRN